MPATNDSEFLLNMYLNLDKYGNSYNLASILETIFSWMFHISKAPSELNRGINLAWINNNNNNAFYWFWGNLVKGQGYSDYV
jgi:hypothetical protein